MRHSDFQKVDRSLVQVKTLEQADDRDDVRYWQSRPPLERLQGLELLRQAMYDYDPNTARLPRVFTLDVQARR